MTVGENEETIQVLTVPTLQSRKKSLSVDILRTINSRIILSHLYLKNRQLYEKRFKSQKAVRDLGNPLDFTSSYLEEVQIIKDSYAQILSPYHVPRFSDFSFLRLLQQVYEFNIKRILSNPRLAKYKIDDKILLPCRSNFNDNHFSITFVYNGGISYAQNVKIIYSGSSHIITNFPYYQVKVEQTKGNALNPVIASRKEFNFGLDKNLTDQLLTHGGLRLNVYNDANSSQTIIEPNDETDDLLLKIIFNYIYAQLLESSINADLGQYSMEFVNDNWSIHPKENTEKNND